MFFDNMIQYISGYSVIEKFKDDIVPAYRCPNTCKAFLPWFSVIFYVNPNTYKYV